MSTFSIPSRQRRLPADPKQFAMIAAMAVVLVAISACEDVQQKVTRISAHGGTSHNGGQNCVQTGCHDINSNIEFSYAGTVYEFDSVTGTPNVPIQNADIHFVTINATGDPLDVGSSIDKTIEVDASGNFYTTEDLSLNYPAQVPCMVLPGTTTYYCMPHTVSNVSGKSCSDASCHLNRRINSDSNYICPGAASCPP